MDSSQPASFIHGILQARILCGLPDLLHDFPDPGVKSSLLCLLHWQVDSLPLALAAKSLQVYPTLCNSMDCNLPGSSAHRVSQARIMDWVVIFLFQGIFFWPRNRTNFSCSSCTQLSRWILYCWATEEVCVHTHTHTHTHSTINSNFSNRVMPFENKLLLWVQSLNWAVSR